MDAKAIKEAWMMSYGNLSSMRVSYSEHLLNPEKDPGTQQRGTPVRHFFVERIEEFPRYHIKISTSEDGFQDPESVRKHSFDGFATREYWGDANLGIIDKGLTGRDVEIINRMSEYLLIGTPMDVQEGPPRPLLEQLFEKYPEHSVRPELEIVNGVSCHVVELNSGKPEFGATIWFAPDKGMMVMRYQRRIGDSYRKSFVVDEVGRTDTGSGPVWYPAKVSSVIDDSDGKTSYLFTAIEFVPNVPVTEETFKVKFPDGAKVVDNIADVKYVIEKGQPTRAEAQHSLVRTGDDYSIDAIGKSPVKGPSPPPSQPRSEEPAAEQPAAAPPQVHEENGPGYLGWLIGLTAIGGIVLVAALVFVRKRSQVTGD